MCAPTKVLASKHFLIKVVDSLNLNRYDVFTVINKETNMNERIRELYKKAHEDGYLNKTFNPEKFAELIVKECVFAVENHGGMCGVTSSKKIREHFGVEE